MIVAIIIAIVVAIIATVTVIINRNAVDTSVAIETSVVIPIFNLEETMHRIASIKEQQQCIDALFDDMRSMHEDNAELYRTSMLELQDIGAELRTIADEVQWVSQPAVVRDNYEYVPHVRACGKKWDADVLARKEKNMKGKNSKRKGQFKPWQSR